MIVFACVPIPELRNWCSLFRWFGTSGKIPKDNEPFSIALPKLCPVRQMSGHRFGHANLAMKSPRIWLTPFRHFHP